MTMDEAEKKELESLTLPELEVTPDIGLLHPLLDGYASNPKSCESNTILSVMLGGSLLALYHDNLISCHLHLPFLSQSHTL